MPTSPPRARRMVSTGPQRPPTATVCRPETRAASAIGPPIRSNSGGPEERLARGLPSERADHARSAWWARTRWAAAGSGRCPVPGPPPRRSKKISPRQASATCRAGFGGRGLRPPDAGGSRTRPVGVRICGELPLGVAQLAQRASPIAVVSPRISSASRPPRRPESAGRWPRLGVGASRRKSRGRVR